MDGKKFQWLIVGMYEEKWWEKGSEETECTAAEIQHALVGTMVLDILPLASNEDITISRRVRLNRNGIRYFLIVANYLTHLLIIFITLKYTDFRLLESTKMSIVMLLSTGSILAIMVTLMTGFGPPLWQ